MVGRGELQFNRSLAFVRRNTIREREAAANAPNQSYLQRQASRLGGTIYQAFTGEKLASMVCSICSDEMKHGDKVVQLKCHELHKLHEGCFRQFIDYNKANNPAMNRCPLCMQPIAEEETKKLVLHLKKEEIYDPANLKAEEAF